MACVCFLKNYYLMKIKLYLFILTFRMSKANHRQLVAFAKDKLIRG